VRESRDISSRPSPGFSDNLKEAAGTGSTFIIHYEIDHLAMDSLMALLSWPPISITVRTVGKSGIRHGMAGDLGYLLVSKGH